MKKISEVFEQRKYANARTFVGYLTAGDPNIEATQAFVQLMDRECVDIIELGVPFSDPVADGPVNQRAAERALKQNTSLKSILGLVEKIRGDGIETPLVLFSYLNPILAMGFETFARTARQKGVTGVLVVDLPPEEAGDFQAGLISHGLETIFLASPTTSPSRLKAIQSLATGFVYYVSRTGVTGVQRSLSESLGKELAQIKKTITSPVAVGFGISTAHHVKEVAEFADGVIVGSAIVEIIERFGSSIPEAKTHLSKLLKPMVIAAHAPSSGHGVKRCLS